MRKVYMKPGIEAFKMEIENMVCVSPGIKDGGAKKDLDVLAPEMDDFVDDIDFNEINSWKL